MIVLVPAYEPDGRLVTLVRALRDAAPDAPVVVVDDGSGPAYRDVFAATAAAGCVVLTHPVNRGKGRALKTGFGHIASAYPGQDVVCADADGQHSVVDILRVAQRVTDTGRAALGVRRFTGPVPLRSRVGNAVTRTVFGALTRRPVGDTQTGLRGYPASMLGWLRSVPGERFEYEMTVLLWAARCEFATEETPIATIYFARNASSHFRPVLDSLRVYGPLLRFSASSLLAFAVDTVVLLVAHALTGALLPSVICARAISSGTNFLVNHRFVFDGRGSRTVGAAAFRYWTLVVLLLGATYLLLAALTSLGLPLLAAKMATEAVLFVVGYVIQRRTVFVDTVDTIGAPPPAEVPGKSGAPA